MKKQVFNPYLPSYEYVPDGEPHVFGNRLYIYGSHDSFTGNTYCKNDYVCWSAPLSDLSDWKYEGVIYKKSQEPLNPEGKKCLWAPDVQQGVDGRYYLYYALSFTSWVGIGVSDRPEGPYEFYDHVQYPDGIILGVKKGDIYQFDPGVLVDDDGRVYLYTGYAGEGFFPGSFGKVHEGGYVVELEADMKTVKKAPKLITPMAGKSDGSGFEGHEFYEASSIRKINGRYYFVYSSIRGHELCYAVSDKPDEGFVYGGTIVSNGDIGFMGRAKEDSQNYIANNHGGLIEVSGQWYIFYHRHTNYGQTSRQGCAEPVVIAEDGGIAQVEMTSCGLNGSALEGKGYYEARIACNLVSSEGAFEYPYMVPKLFRNKKHPYLTQSGEDRESDGDQYIANMRDGAVAGYKYFDLTDTSRIAVSVRGTGVGTIVVSYEMHGIPVAEITVEPSKNWKKFEGEIQPGSEKTALYISFRGKGYIDINGFNLE